MAQGILGNILYDDSLAFLYAPLGRWKSFLALSWALCLATGTAWLGRAVIPVPVLYVACEGARGAGQRIRAWKVHHGLSGPSKLQVLGIPVNLLDPEAVSEFIAAVRAQMAAGVPALIVIDTLARSMPGGDENVAKDANMVTDNLNRIRQAFGCCVLVVHHPGKEATKGMRGSSALAANADTVIRIAAPNDNDPVHPGDALTVVSEKAKDGECFEPISFTTQKVSWVRDDTGEIGSSLVIIGSDQPPETNAGGRAVIRHKPSAADRLLALIKTHHPDGASQPTLLKLFTEQTELSRATFYRAIDDLEAGGDIENVMGFYKLIRKDGNNND